MIEHIQYWNPLAGVWQDAPPKVAVGDIAGIAALITGEASKARVDILVTFPDSSQQPYQGDIQNIPRGYTCTWKFTWSCTLEGSYMAQLQEYAGESLVDDWGPGLVAIAERTPSSVIGGVVGMTLPLVVTAGLGMVLSMLGGALGGQ